MGKTRPPERSKLDRRKKKLLADKKRKNAPSHTPAELLAQATILLQQGDPEPALEVATTALRQLKTDINADEDVINCLPALNLLGEISVELGELDTAREYFGQAAQIDEDGDIAEEKGGGADKFLWLAQLSEEGGEDSVKWFLKAAHVLRDQIQDLDDEDIEDAEIKTSIEEKKAKLANALCAIAEVYMTDLSWDEKAEARCSKLMEEALDIAPNNPETLQTAASVLISQSKRDEARRLLTRSLSLWKVLPIESPQVPEFAVRISLVRLLMEVEMEEDAIKVVERLIREDDHSVEAWYLGGWCLHLIAKNRKPAANGHSEKERDDEMDLLRRCRRWLLWCLKLYNQLEYEDEPLKIHVDELVETLNQSLGPVDETEELAETGAEDGSWESAEDSNDEIDEDDSDAMED